MFSKATILLFFTILAVVAIRTVETYRVPQARFYLNTVDDEMDSRDVSFLDQLQSLVATARLADAEGDVRDVPLTDHLIRTRMAINRRPGLLRLRKSY